MNSLRPRKMFYDKAYKNWETAQQIVRHYDLIRKTVRL
jgi:hypothetical protein